MSRLDLIRVFIYVVESGSFSVAAKRLNVTRSLVSKKISQLEKHLGTQLLYRTTRKISTTDAGQSLFLKCEKIISGLEEAEQSLLNLDDSPRGHLRIVCTDILGEKFVSRIAAMFNECHPQLRIEVHVTSRNVDLVSEGYDLATRYGDLTDSSLKARKVCELSYMVCASPSYIKKHGKPKSFDDLKNHACLVTTFEPCTSWSFRVDKKNVVIDLEGNWRSNNATALISASIEGLGICRLPELYVKEYIESGQLVSVLEDFPCTPLPVWFVYPNTRYVPTKTRLFIDFFIEKIQTLADIKN